MKDILNNLGGHPLTTNDLNQIRDGAFERLTAVINALKDSGETFIILDGLVLTGAPATATWTTGTVVFNGLFYTVDEQTTPVDLRSFTITTAYVPDGDQPVIYENGDPVNVRGSNKLSLTAGSGAEDLFNDAQRLQNLLATHLIDNGSLIDKLLSNSLVDSAFASTQRTTLTVGANWTTNYPVQIIKQGNMIQMRGRLTGTVSSALEVLSGIPANMQVVSDRSVGVDIKKDATGLVERGTIIVRADGTVDFDFSWHSFAVDDNLIFDGAFYSLD